MKKIFNTLFIALVCLVLTQTNANASSHREAPLISNDPLADNTDVYAFRSPADTNKVVLIANYIPFEHPAGGPNWYTFGENIRYEIHIDNSTATTGDDIIYRFTFRQVNEDSTTFFRIRLGKENWKTFYTLERSMNGGSSFTTVIANGVVPAPNIGPRSIENSTVGLGVPNYDTLMFRGITTATSGERVFAGPIDDPFFVDLGGIFDLGNIRNPGRDGLAKFNCHSLVVEVPISTLQKDGKTTTQASTILDPDFVIGVYANASRLAITTFDSTTGKEVASGDWVQVSRLGMPLTNEVVIPIGAKDPWNATATNNESAFYKYFRNPELALYMDDSQFGGAVPGLKDLRVQTNSLGMFDFRNGKPGLFPVKGTPGAEGTAFGSASPYRDILLPDNMSPRSADLLPIFLTGVPNLRPYQLATGKNGNPLAAGKPFVHNFLPTLGDMLRLNMAVPVTARNSADFSSLGLVQAAVLGLTDSRFNTNTNLEFIPNMDGFPNGRRLEDDVTRIELQAVGGVVLAAIGLWYDDYPGSGSPVTPQLQRTLGFTAGPTMNDTTFKSVFPFVQAPWRGFVGASYSGPKSLQTLPVSFTSFTADKVGTKVQLRWNVANELNVDYYEVEYSLGAGVYKSVGRVDARSGSSNSYSLVHSDPLVGKANYYRIKQVDRDGKVSYSPLRLIKFDSQNLITVTPNPASNFIKVYSNQVGIRVHLVDESGKRLMTQLLTTGNGEFNISRLAKGVYIVVAENNGERVQTTRVVKQ